MKHEISKPTGRTVLLFRKRMLPYSETFIAAQGNCLPSWKAVFSGVTKEQSGLNLLDQSNTSILTQRFIHKPYGSVMAYLFKRFGFIPKVWLNSLQSYHPSLLHVHFGPDALFMGIPLKKELRIPLLVTFHGFDITIDAPKKPLPKNLPKLFAEADRIISVSDYIKNQLLLRGCPEEKIITHYIGLDIEKFIPLSSDVPRKDIVYVGRLTEKKGVTYLIQAMKQLANQGHCYHLHIIGDGKLRKSLEEQARVLGDQVTFYGNQNQDFVRKKLSSAAVSCSPSVTSQNGDSEGLGMVNLEAMALKTPVVSTFHTAIPEAVIHEKTGILVPERDSDALAAALLRCLMDKEFSQMLGENGYQRVHANFNIYTQGQKLEEIYNSVVPL